MKERIDKFMQAAREKYHSNGLAWENLYRELKETASPEDREYLVAQWHEFHQGIKLAKWDDAFMELVINGTTAKQSRASVATYAQGAAMGNDVMQQKMAETLRRELRFHGVENPERLMK